MLNQEEAQVETRAPVAPPPETWAPETRPPHRQTTGAIVGGILIIVGVMSLLGTVWPSESIGLLVLPVLGGIFLAWAYVQHRWPLLIPGCILMGLGLGTFVQETWLKSLTGEARGAIVVLGLALGFLAIIPLVQLMDQRLQWWAAIPGGILLAVALGMLAGPNGLPFLQMLNTLWPFALIIVGGYLIWMVYWRRSERTPDRERHGLPT